MMSEQKTESQLEAEVGCIRARYKRRSDLHQELYDPRNPYVYMAQQEKQQALVRWVNDSNLVTLSEKRVLEIGCGVGTNLVMLMKLGFRPENIVANELLTERAEEARNKLPQAIRFKIGNALQVDFGRGGFDVVLQSTVFTSILNTGFQKRLAEHMWSAVRPGGGVLWYDFIYDNPRNPDVRGVPLNRVRALFPETEIACWRVTLAPPIGRLVTRIHPNLYHVFNYLPFLRTHILCWIKKST